MIIAASPWTVAKHTIAERSESNIASAEVNRTAYAQDKEMAAKLWAESERLTGARFPQGLRAALPH